MQAETAIAADRIGADVAARIERLPISWWHTKLRLVAGSAWFFDAFDSLTIAYVLPVLAGLWSLAPAQIGFLISIGYAGQMLGSIFFGWISDRIGRVPSAIITLLIFTLASLACAFAWDFQSLFWIRFVQGLGLGGENPVITTYINEFAPAERRGRFSLSVQLVFILGLMSVALVGSYVVPRFGWQALFVIGAIPALIVLPMRTVLPESPRWLASRGRRVEADRIVSRIEAIVSRDGRTALPPIPLSVPSVAAVRARVSDLFRGIYRKRTFTIWALWACTYMISYGLSTWMPTLYRTVFKLPVQQALLFGFIGSFTSLLGGVACMLLVDRLGRRPLFAAALLLSAVPLVTLALLAMGAVETLDPVVVMLLVVTATGCAAVVALGLGMYTAENYPNTMRALGSGVAGGWQRDASMVGPLLIGVILPTGGISAVFLCFAGFAVIGSITCAVFAVETRGKVLEIISPPL